MGSPRADHPLAEVAAVFLRLGTIAFGGPAAHIAMMEEEIVRRRQWVSRDEFLDLLGAVHLIPGPNSTELAIHLGHRRAGWPGLIVAGACFILPAAVIVTAIAWAYVRFGTLPDARGLLAGIQPVILAVVAQALVGLAHSAVKSRLLAAAGVLAFVASALGLHELAVLFGTGVLSALAAYLSAGKASGAGSSRTMLMPLAAAPSPTTTLAAGSGAAAATMAIAPGAWAIFGLFLKIGSVLFGSGYVLLAFLRSDLVERRGWLTEPQLLDAVAVGQFTPGPVFTTATFIGYLLAGFPGAVAATIGIFLPAFIFVALSGPLIPRLRQSPTAGAMLDGVTVASLALMTLVTLQLGRAAIQGPWTAALAGLSALLLLRFKTNSAWLVLAGAAAGWLTHRLKG